MTSLTRRRLSGLCLAMLTVLSGCGHVEIVDKPGPENQGTEKPGPENQGPENQGTVKPGTDNQGGASGTTEALQIQPFFVLCFDGAKVTRCLRAIEIQTGIPRLLYDRIEGFQFEWGYEAQILVEDLPNRDPLPDGSSAAYKLIAPIAKTKIIGKYFHLLADLTVLSPEDAPSVLPGGCEQGYSIAGDAFLPGRQLAFDSSVTCQTFESALQNGLTDVVVALPGSDPGAPLSVGEIKTN